MSTRKLSLLVATSTTDWKRLRRRFPKKLASLETDVENVANFGLHVLFDSANAARR